MHFFRIWFPHFQIFYKNRFTLPYLPCFSSYENFTFFLPITRVLILTIVIVLSVFLSIYFFVCSSSSLSIGVFVCSSICLSIYVCVCSLFARTFAPMDSWSLFSSFLLPARYAKYMVFIPLFTSRKQMMSIKCKYEKRVLSCKQ